MIVIDQDCEKSLSEQIYACIVQEIITGNRRAGEKLPATRRLAVELCVSRNTVNAAYQQLMVEGYVEARGGSGYLVNEVPIEVSSPKEQHYLTPVKKVGKSIQEYDYAFEYGAIDNECFPFREWRKSMAHALDQIELSPRNVYPDRQGDLSLRSELSRYLYQSRGVTCDVSQIIITAGHQYSMEILANVFQNSGKIFAMENPGYDGIRTVFSNHKYYILPVPVERDGICMDVLQTIRPDLLYLTPSHQFPLGCVLPVAKRKKILQWAYENNTYIIEDDYDSELRYYTNPLPSMHSLDYYNRTIYAGSFSKSLSPSLRTAYLVLPKHLMSVYHHYYQRYNSYVSHMIQLAISDFMSSGRYERHLNRIRMIYRKKQESFLNAVEDIFGTKAECIGDKAGMHILLEVRANLSQEELQRRAKKIGIMVYPTRQYYMTENSCPENQLLLGFSSIPDHKFRELLTALHNVWFTT